MPPFFPSKETQRSFILKPPLSLSLFLKAELLQDQQEKTCFFELEGGGEREGDCVVVARENDRDSALEPERGTPTLVSFWEVVERVDSCWSISLLSFLLKLARKEEDHELEEEEEEEVVAESLFSFPLLSGSQTRLGHADRDLTMKILNQKSNPFSPLSLSLSLSR